MIAHQIDPIGIKGELEINHKFEPHRGSPGLVVCMASITTLGNRRASCSFFLGTYHRYSLLQRDDAKPEYD